LSSEWTRYYDATKDEPRETAVGDPKHWHVFHIARTR
jgi:hypothetical protein